MRARFDRYEEAVALRKRGLSYPEISRRLQVATSTLSGWLQEMPVVLGRRKVMPSEIFRTQGQRLHAERLEKIAITTEQAWQEIGSLSPRELLIADAMLYWAEGSKDPKREIVEISNSDPKFVHFTLRWLREVCRVPDHKIRLKMHVHTDLDPEACLTFWM